MTSPKACSWSRAGGATVLGPFTHVPTFVNSQQVDREVANDFPAPWDPCAFSSEINTALVVSV